MIDRQLTDWAASGESTDPGVGLENNGYPDGSIPAHDETNYAWRQFASAPAGYATLEDAAAAMPVGAIAVVDEANFDAAFLANKWSSDVGAGSDIAVAISADGEFVFVGTSTGEVECRRRASGSLVWNVDLGAVTVRDLHCDGAFVWVSAAAGDIHKLRRDTGANADAVNWPYTGFIVVESIYSDSVTVWCAGNGVDGTNELVGLDPDTATPGSTLNNGSFTINAVISDGEAVYVAMDRDTGNNKVYRKFSYDLSLEIDSFVDANLDGGSAIALTENMVLLGVNNDGANEEACLYALPRSEAAWSTSPIWKGATTSGAFNDTAQAVATDGRFVFVVTNSNANYGELQVFDLVTGRRRASFNYGVDDLWACDCDGFGLFIGGEHDGTYNVFRKEIHRLPTLVRRFDPAEEHRPMMRHQLVLPAQAL